MPICKATLIVSKAAIFPRNDDGTFTGIREWTSVFEWLG